MEELKRVIVKSRSCHKDELLLSIFGFVAVIFTYLGVNLLLSGLHSYGGG